MKRREIVQSRGRWRAILPQPVATWLAKRALENQPPLGIAKTFLGCGNPRLLRSFAHRLSFSYDSAAAQRIAGAWLGPGGPMSDLGDPAQRDLDLHIDLLTYLAPVAPSAALDLIARFVDDATLDQLKASEYLRIPRKLDSRSTANWTPVPPQTGRLFQVKLDSRSEATRGGGTVYAVMGGSVNVG